MNSQDLKCDSNKMFVFLIDTYIINIGRESLLGVVKCIDCALARDFARYSTLLLLVSFAALLLKD